MKKGDKIVSLLQWIWYSYLKTALIPIFIVELGVIGIYFLSNSWVNIASSNNVRDEVHARLEQVSKLEAENISHQLMDITHLTGLFAKQMETALQTDKTLTDEQQSVMRLSPEGVYYTTQDTGGAAVFYSGYVPVGNAEKDKLARALTGEMLMRDIFVSDPLVASLYLNTHDSLNVIYPYFDVISQYAPHVNIPEFNFYYEADAAHNPDRTVRWTDVYLDPAGHGWMASSIAPVYSGDFLEGVVGIDITVKNFVEQVLNMDISWDGYGMLVGGDGTILAVPEQGEKDWNVLELMDHTYEGAVIQDTFKADEFNLYSRDDLAASTYAMAQNAQGITNLSLNGETKVVAWHTVAETGWKFIIVVPEANIYAGVRALNERQFTIGIIMILGVALFYLVFFLVLYRRARRMSLDISQPLQVINNMAKAIGDGQYNQEAPEFQVNELKETTESIMDMGNRLGKANADMTEAQAALEASEAYLKALVHSIDDAIYEVDERGVVKNVRTNDPRILASIFPNGLSETTTLGSFLTAQEAAEYLQAAHQVLETGRTASVEYKTDTANGFRWFLARIARISDSARTVVVSLRDITEQKKLELRINEALVVAEKASRAKSEFLSNMSHELRTPLNAVLGFAQVMELDPETPLNKVQQDSVYEIKKAGNHLLQLINEILDLSRIESGKVTLSLEPILVADMMEESLALMKPMAEQYGVTLHMHCGTKGDVFVRADRMRLKQVLINLLSNAIKYNREGGAVRYACEQTGGVVRIHVEDTGIGMPKEELEEIFKPFHRLNMANHAVEGTGIGLPMVKKLMDLMHGSISVTSTVLVGSHFVAELPLAEPVGVVEAPHGTGKWQKRPQAASERKKVLYVEDNPANLSLVEKLMTHMPQVELLTALTGGLGLDLARAHLPSVILLDINLPDLDGYEVFKRLRGFEETKDIPVIAISANAMAQDIRRAMAMGFTAYLTKPIDAKELFELLDKQLYGG